jgi:predicted site-specific integrase-resolvase
LTTLSEEIENQLNVYLKLFVILYADDTVIMLETKEDLQKQINVFSEYCKYWQLKVNVEKINFFVFSRERLPNNLTFTFNEMEIGILSECNYLGVLLSKSGNFSNV